MSGLDLFAGGAGGWDQPGSIGIELDEHATATRLARGLKTIQADVSKLDPQRVRHVMGGRVDFITGSPPCPPFSTAGNGYGFQDRELICAAIRAGAPLGPMADERSALSVQPLRWVLDVEPEWFAFEQVPGALDIWEATAARLEEELGYSTWSGVLNAADYGVAQTRRRAILIGHRTQMVAKPPPRAPKLVMRDLFPDADWIALRMGRARGTRRTIDKAAPTLMFGKSPSGIVFEFEDDSERTISIDEAAQIQGLAPGIPWKGGRVAAFQQIGNAIPPPLAAAVIDAVVNEQLVIQ